MVFEMMLSSFWAQVRLRETHNTRNSCRTNVVNNEVVEFLCKIVRSVGVSSTINEGGISRAGKDIRASEGAHVQEIIQLHF